MKHTVELSDKELFLVWAIICWFNKPVTGTLKAKFSGLALSPLRKKFDAMYESVIQDRMISNGKFLEGYREKERDEN